MGREREGDLSGGGGGGATEKKILFQRRTRIITGLTPLIIEYDAMLANWIYFMILSS